MEVTTLRQLLLEDGVRIVPSGLEIHVHKEWIVPGEDRLSYTSLVRLVECCREHHWEADIQPVIVQPGLDSITYALTAKFHKPTWSGTTISIMYSIVGVGKRSYTLKFQVSNEMAQTLAEVELISVFYDPLADRSVAPPESLLDHLRRKCVPVADQ